MMTTSHGIELRPLLLDRSAAAALVGFAERHFDAPQSAYPTLLVAEHFDRIGEHPEDDPLLLGVVHLLGARRKLRLERR